MNVLQQEQARDLATRLAGASQSRRLYAANSPMWARTLDAFKADVDGFFRLVQAPDLSVALLGEGLAVCGVPILNPPPTVVKLISALKARDIEIVALRKEVTTAELEVLMSFLSADAADVAGMRGTNWLRERGVVNVDIKHLKLMRGRAAVGSFRDVFRVGAQVLGQEFRRAAATGMVDMAPVAELAGKMLQLVLGSETPVATLLALRDRDDCTYVHSVNVGMLAGLQAAALGLPEHIIHEISTAGLLHDIGKVRVPEGVLQKRAPLTAAEVALLQAHTWEGARMLLATQGAEHVAPVVAGEHHLPASTPSTQAPLLASQLVALADTFDNLRSLRPFDDVAGKRSALSYMHQQLAGRFNPYLLGRFGTLCGMLEAGDVVRLSSGEIGRVAAAHAEIATHCLVEIVDTAQGDLPAGTQVDMGQAAMLAAPRWVVVPMTVAFEEMEPREVDAMG